jgi:hypothetical protein
MHTGVEKPFLASQSEETGPSNREFFKSDE